MCSISYSDPLAIVTELRTIYVNVYFNVPPTLDVLLTSFISKLIIVGTN